MDLVIIATADRPRYVRRCIESLCRSDDLAPSTIVVIDGSRSAADRAETLANVGAVRQRVRGRIKYFGPSEADRLRALLEADGIPGPLIKSCTQLGAVGVARNLGLLVATGRHVLMVDDDVIATPWAFSDAAWTLSFEGERDPRRWAFFRTRQAATDGLPDSPWPMLAAHRRVLGRTVAELSHAYGPIAQNGRHCASDTMHPRATVKATLSGLAGDTARYCGYHLLFATGHLRSQLLSRPQQLSAALASREVRRGVCRVTLTRHIDWAAYCLGLATSETTPPFLPVSRGEDTFFGALSRLLDPDALYAYVPVGVVHDSPRTADYGIDALCGACETRLVDVYLSILDEPLFRDCTRSPHIGPPSLRTVGAVFRQIASVPLEEFRRIATTAVRRRRGRMLEHLNNGVAIGDVSGAWDRAVATYTEQLRTSLTCEQFFVPTEYAGSGPEAGMRQARETLGEFGTLMEQWDVFRQWFHECPAILDWCQ